MTKKNSNNVPKHIGIIMDGNRRWAKEKGLPVIKGHYHGLYDALIPLLDACIKRKIKYTTLFAFSAENWSRPKKEVNYLLLLFKKIVEDELETFHKKGVKFNFLGRLEDFPKNLQKLAEKAVERTKNNTKIICNICASYGGKAEIVDATKKIIKAGISPDELNEKVFQKFIYGPNLPNPDLIIRTSGEQRLSGFMLWQSDYAELYFTPVMWPDFNEKELDEAILDFQNRKRRFGK